MSGGPSPEENTAIGVPSREATLRCAVRHGRQLVAHVRLALLVVGAVAEGRNDEAAVLVEPAGAVVDLERVQLEAARPPRLRELDELAADPSAMPRGLDVELVDSLAVQDHHRDDPSVVLGDPGLRWGTTTWASQPRTCSSVWASGKS